MKKSLLYIALLCLSTASIVAQTRAPRTFDNFDTMRGVQIITPTAPPVVITTSAKNKKLVKKTGYTKPVVVVQDKLDNTIRIINYSKLSMSAGRTMGAFTTGDDKVDSYITDSSVRYNIDPLLIYSQMHQESSFKPRATSNKGARGLMQLMPGTAIRFGVTNIYDPKQNIEAGIKYMRWLMDKFDGDVALALAGYNAGEGAVMKYGNQIPPYRETQEYVRRISSRYASILNPSLLAKTTLKVTNKQAEKLEKKESAPLTVFERSALTIRRADGKMLLVNQ